MLVSEKTKKHFTKARELPGDPISDIDFIKDDNQGLDEMSDSDLLYFDLDKATRSENPSDTWSVSEFTAFSQDLLKDPDLDLERINVYLATAQRMLEHNKVVKESAILSWITIMEKRLWYIMGPQNGINPVPMRENVEGMNERTALESLTKRRLIDDRGCFDSNASKKRKLPGPKSPLLVPEKESNTDFDEEGDSVDSLSPNRLSAFQGSNDVQILGINSRVEPIETQKLRYDLSADDLKCLQDGEWLTGAVIREYSNRILKPINPLILVLDPSFYSAGNNHWYGWYDNFELRDYWWIIIPLHLHGNHWSVVFFCTTSFRFYYCDSMPSQQSNHDSICRKLKKFFIDRSLNGNFTWVNCKMPQQSNFDDCGVYMLRFIKDLLDHSKELKTSWDSGTDLKNRYPPHFVSTFRKQILACLSQQAALDDTDFHIFKDIPEGGEVVIDKAKTLALIKLKTQNNDQKKPISREAQVISSILKKCSDSIAATSFDELDIEVNKNFCTAEDLDVSFKSLKGVVNENFGEDLDWIHEFDPAMNQSPTEDFDIYCLKQVEGIRTLISLNKGTSFLQVVKRYRLGMLLVQEMSRKRYGERTEFTRRFKSLYQLDPVQLVNEYYVKSYFIQLHPTGKGILRCLNMPWNLMARNSTFRSILDKGLLSFAKPVGMKMIECAAETKRPNSHPIQLLDKVGLDRLQRLDPNDQMIWSGKYAFAKKLGIDKKSELLNDWETFARSNRTQLKRLEAFQLWLIEKDL